MLHVVHTYEGMLTHARTHARAHTHVATAKQRQAHATFKTAKRNMEQAISLHSKRIEDATASNLDLETHIPRQHKLKGSSKAEYVASSSWPELLLLLLLCCCAAIGLMGVALL